MGNPILRSGAAAVVASATGTTLTATHPSGSQAGDLILIWNGSPDTSVTWTAPGFSAALPGPGTSMSVQLLWKTDTGAEPASYAVTSSAATNSGLIIAAYGNVDQAILFDPAAFSGQSNDRSTIITAGGITTLFPNSQLVWFGMIEVPSGSPVITQPGGYTTRVSQATSTSGTGINIAVLMADSVGAVPGATGAVTGISSLTEFNGALLLGIPVANPVPTGITSGPGGRLRRFGPELRRGRHFAGGLSQGALSASYPVSTGRRSDRRAPALPLRILRTRIFSQPFPQGTSSQAYPAWISRSTKQRPGILFLRRGRIFVPVPASAPAAALFPLFTQQRPGPVSRRGLRARRGQFFQPAIPQGLQGAPFLIPARRRAADRTVLQGVLRIVRRRIFAPVLPQGRQGVPIPLFIKVPAGRRPPALPRLRRARVFHVPIPKINQTASAALSGTGTLSAAALVTKVSSAAFSGTGTLRASGTITRFGSAALSGTGTLFAQARLTKFAAAALSGTGTLTASAVVTKLAAAALSGTGTLTASAADTPAARLSGTGTLTAGPVLTVQAAAAMAGTGTLTAGATSAKPSQRITITPNAETSWQEIIETDARNQRETHAGESYVYTANLDDGIFDA